VKLAGSLAPLAEAITAITAAKLILSILETAIARPPIASANRALASTSPSGA
jgi:hypothetical protein